MTAAMEAFADRILPEDEHGPGAVAMGATVAIERALAADLAASRPAVQEALQALGDGFATWAPEEQDAAVARLEATDPVAFALLRGLVIEGAFGDPAHGGNAGGAGWALLGYPGPRRVVPAEDQVIRDIA
jgi:gluconate 2-dehydrogenase gamma chain